MADALSARKALEKQPHQQKKNLEAENQGPDEAEGQARVPFDNVFGGNVLELDFVPAQKVERLAAVLELRGQWGIRREIAHPTERPHGGINLVDVLAHAGGLGDMGAGHLFEQREQQHAVLQVLEEVRDLKARAAQEGVDPARKRPARGGITA